MRQWAARLAPAFAVPAPLRAFYFPGLFAARRAPQCVGMFTCVGADLS